MQDKIESIGERVSSNELWCVYTDNAGYRFHCTVITKLSLVYFLKLNRYKRICEEATNFIVDKMR